MSVGPGSGNQQNQPAAAKRGAEDVPDLNELKSEVSEIADVAVERGRQFVESARTQATDYVDRRKDDVASSVADLANSLRESTRAFEDRPNIRTFVDSAAQGLDQLADTIRSRSFADIFNEVEDVMRRRPAVIAGATTVAGFLIARFIKASADNIRTYDQQRQAGGPRTQQHAAAQKRPASAQGGARRAGM